MTPMDRLMQKTTKHPGGCWLFAGCKDSGGYGMIGVNGKGNKAHRISWATVNGPIPSGLMVLHRCDIPNCINPDHLFLGTQLDNMRDCKAKGRLVPPPARKGELNTMARLSDEIVLQMRSVRAREHISYKQIGIKFGVSTMTAYRAVVGQSWKEVA